MASVCVLRGRDACAAFGRWSRCRDHQHASEAQAKEMVGAGMAEWVEIPADLTAAMRVARRGSPRMMMVRIQSAWAWKKTMSRAGSATVAVMQLRRGVAAR